MAELFAVSIIVLLLSVIIHEVAHGLAALHFGDHTAERAGRLTLNPIPHIDPIGSILIPALFILPALLFNTIPGAFIGWAKPVPVNPLNFRDGKRAELFVALAGVGANFGLALLGATFWHLSRLFLPNFFFLSIADTAVTINLMLGVFNLLPIPPLDGSKVLITQLPYNMARKLIELERYSFLLLFLLLFFRVGNTSILGLILGITVGLLKTVLGIG